MEHSQFVDQHTLNLQWFEMLFPKLWIVILKSKKPISMYNNNAMFKLRVTDLRTQIFHQW